MRISGGQARGRSYSRNLASRTRPPLARIRQSVFSILGDRIEGSAVLDLFAGSGAFGFEAMSRGARAATFVESDRHAVRLLEASAQELGFSINTRVVRLDALSGRLLGCLRGQESNGVEHAYQPFDVIFLDPPFDLLRQTSGRERIEESLSGLLEAHELAADAIAVLRHPSDAAAELPIRPFDSRQYGKSTVSFFRRSESGSKEE